MKCARCGKPYVHPEDWGDYDDACEWACRCKHPLPLSSYYGHWRPSTKVHAVDVNHRWLCDGEEGLTSTKCSDDLRNVDCKRCRAKLARMGVEI